ncbi:LolA family protein [Acetobacter fallax]|uniref:Outer membrane lipoprotein carrier protein LolA n=1 Tax=Acetobacter fallax TaxID=1737473 RepID=A0ABX0KC26_9PROT|nr:outer membrane lipoprotein carrier protein LolA [Acetobacter fallax]NHO32999.1 outer membrane lipoprotein carrier protein LolA [Acetobacter fallax]NHO36632.1 outer membrane lipoprotein carrier protein LolA [Acetobacter fallax]
MTRVLSRRAALLAGLALAACARSGTGLLSGEDQRDVARVEAYFNGLTSLRLLFEQAFIDGGHGSGVMSYAPGRFRLDYTVPRGMTLVAGDGHLVLTNPQNGAVTRMGLSHTPLGLLLARPVRLSGGVTVTSVKRGPGMLQMSLAKTDRMSDGLLTLQFGDAGGVLTLSGIVLVDDRQHVTTLRIEDVA